MTDKETIAMLRRSLSFVSARLDEIKQNVSYHLEESEKMQAVASEGAREWKVGNITFRADTNVEPGSVWAEYPDGTRTQIIKNLGATTPPDDWREVQPATAFRELSTEETRIHGEAFMSFFEPAPAPSASDELAARASSKYLSFADLRRAHEEGYLAACAVKNREIGKLNDLIHGEDGYIASQSQLMRELAAKAVELADITEERDELEKTVGGLEADLKRERERIVTKTVTPLGRLDPARVTEAFIKVQDELKRERERSEKLSEALALTNGKLNKAGVRCSLADEALKAHHESAGQTGVDSRKVATKRESAPDQPGVSDGKA